MNFAERKEPYKTEVSERYFELYLDYLSIKSVKKEIEFSKTALSFYQKAKDMLVKENSYREEECNLALDNSRVLLIRDKRIELIEQAISELEQSPSPQQETKEKPKLGIGQIALKYAYEGLQITRENSNNIAGQYGYSSKTSGEYLYQTYSTFSSPSNRKGKPDPCTKKKLQNKIDLLKSVVELLPVDKQQRAKEEVKILEIIYENEFE